MCVYVTCGHMCARALDRSFFVLSYQYSMLLRGELVIGPNGLANRVRCVMKNLELGEEDRKKTKYWRHHSIKSGSADDSWGTGGVK